MRVLVLDPGEKVGWASAEIVPGHRLMGRDDEGQIVTTPCRVLKVTGHGISLLKPMALATHRAVAVDDKYDVVVYESWRLAKGLALALSGSEMPSSQFIGMVRMAVWLNPRVRIVAQSPSVMKTADLVIPNHYPDIADRIAKAPKSHDESHDTSALRHLAYFHYKRFI